MLALATATSILLMRGIRGVLGVRWLSLELATPESSRLLTSIDPTAMGSLLANLVVAHDAEVQRQGGGSWLVAASRSGGAWLVAASTPEGTAGLRMCAARLTAALPLGRLQPARPTALTDAAMSDLLRSCKGIFPFVQEKQRAITQQ